MIYTAIYQDASGKVSSGKYAGSPDRPVAYRNAASMGETDGRCLVALVPGDHPLYTYEDLVAHDRAVMQRHDLFELNNLSEDSL